MFPNDILTAAEALLAAARDKKLRLATAESCTGGLIAGALTEIAGSSDVFERGFVTYSNEAKFDLLGVPATLVAAEGAVSLATAEAMARGAVARSNADIAVAVSGVAGPGGGSADKPVGLVCFGTAQKGGPTHAEDKRFGDIGRGGVRLDAVRHALFLLFREVSGHRGGIS